MAKQNVFMASMYFFIRLEEPVSDVTKEKGWNAIEPPLFAGSLKAQCQCQHEHEYNDLCFTFVSRDEKDAEISREAKLHSFYLRFTQHKDKPQYYWVLGTKVDLMFYDTPKGDNITPLCTEMDLVWLKKAFVDPNACLTLKDSNKALHSCIASKLPGIDKVSHSNTDFAGSLIQIYGTECDVNMNNLKALDETFNKNFYLGANEDLYHSITSDMDSLAYGLLHANTNYRRISPENVSQMLECSYSNNHVERTYASENTIVTIQGHYPYTVKANDLHNHTLKDKDLLRLPNVMMLCSILSAKRAMQDIRPLLYCQDAATIKKALAHITALQNRKLFRLPELETGFRRFLKGMGVTGELEQLQSIGNMQADSVNIKNIQKVNRMMYFLTGITIIIGIISILISVYN